MTPEGKVKDMVKAVLKSLGAHWFMPVTRGYGTSGMADIIVCLPPNGRMVLIETKATGNKARPMQAAQINRMVKCGAVGVVVSADAGRLVAASATHDSPSVEIKFDNIAHAKQWLELTLTTIQSDHT